MLFILLVALGLRLFHLESQPVWCDESYFWMCANHPGWIVTLLHTMADDVYPPLYFLLLHGLGLFTDNLFLIRLPSALAGVAAVWVLMSFLRRRVSSKAALYAGALAAVSPLLVYYSQELKMYSILALLLMLLFDETVSCLDDPKRPSWKLTVYATLSVYTFYLSLIPWACFLTLALRKRARNVLKGYFIAGLLFLPWSPFFIKSVLVNQGSVHNFFPAQLPLFSLQNFSLGFWTLGPMAWVGFFCFGVAAFFGLKEHPRLRVLAFGPLALSWIVTLLSKPMYSDRAMLVSCLGWLGLAGVGLARFPRWTGRMGLALLLAMSCWSLSHYYYDPLSRRADYMPAWEHVSAQWKPGDSVFHQALASYYPFKFYALQESKPVSKLNWIYTPPPPFTNNKGAGLIREQWRKINAWLATKGMALYTGYPKDFVYAERLEKEALPGVRRVWYLNTEKAAAERVWLPQMNVYKHGLDNVWTPFEPEKIDWLKKRFHLVRHDFVGDVDIYLFEKNKR